MSIFIARVRARTVTWPRSVRWAIVGLVPLGLAFFAALAPSWGTPIGTFALGLWIGFVLAVALGQITPSLPPSLVDRNDDREYLTRRDD